MITSRLIDRNVKFTRLRRFPQEASSSKKLLLVAVLAILGALTACGDAHLPLLTSITVSPANSTIDTGQTQQFTAMGTFSDGSSRDLTNLVTWSSSNTTVATISSSGLALGHGQGSSMISATFNTADGPVTGATSARCGCDFEIADHHSGESVHCQRHKPAAYRDRDFFGREYSGSHGFGELEFVLRCYCDG